MRVSYKVSVVISMVLIVVLFIALGVLTQWLPDLVTSMIDTADNWGARAEITSSQRLLILIDSYVMVAVAYVAVVLLFFLLHTVLREQVFSRRTVCLLNAISWCCFGEGILFMLLVVWFQVAFGVAVAAFCLGVCLRVVKHVIEEAIRFKSENDLTI